MGTRVVIRCKWCNKQLVVPVQAQTITCPVCRRTNHLAPVTNGGYYQQQPPPMHNYNQRVSRPPAYNHQQSMRPHMNYGSPMPGTMYNNGRNQRPSSPSTYNRQESMRPPMYNDNNNYNQQPMNNSPPMPGTMYNNGHNQRPSRPSTYNRQQSMSPPMYNDNDNYNQYVSSPSINKHNSTYSQQVPSTLEYNNKGGYNQQVSTPPTSVYGRKRAVLCGISYQNTEHSLDGSVTDVESIKRLLIDRMGFPDSSVVVLTEAERHPLRVPTAKNITAALHWLVQGCKAGDSLVFYYTGHGSRVPDDDNDEYDGYDEALCPVDYKTAGKIIDDKINDIIVKPLPRGAQLHAIVDTCHSGTVLDLCFICRMNSRGKYFWEDHEKPYGAFQGTNGGLAVSISACDDHQKSGNTTAFTGKATGALTYSFVKAMQSEPTLTYGQLMSSMRTEINKVQSGLGLNSSNASTSTQEPQLSSSEKFDILSKKFLL